ncbi:Proteasome, subunit alpha/beta [Corchorus olitorius]|uniref:Proteasome, subunit alpha/beta n=1 Tax=Corchorus olitorius TaxID=93759 RepID=A0A1R3IUQ4_9ROSI|nr:Proteasome, subunit alpha/beta [Corchorus olitorius]
MAIKIARPRLLKDGSIANLETLEGRYKSNLSECDREHEVHCKVDTGKTYARKNGRGRSKEDLGRSHPLSRYKTKRATVGPIVCDKNYEKIHYMAPNIYCCGARTAADTEGSDWYQGHVQAALVLGRVDVTGPHFHTIYPHGSTDALPFAMMGSGSLAVMAVFESKYREGLILSSFVIYHEAVVNFIWIHKICYDFD